MLLALCLLLSGGDAEAASYRLTLAGGLGGAAAPQAGPPSLGAYGVGRALLELGPSASVTHRRRIALDLAGREGYATHQARTLGAIFAGGRLTFGEEQRRYHARVGFAHHHEVPWDVFVDAPVPSLAGVAKGIIHRSGVELGGGVDLAVPGIFKDRLGAILDLSLALMPDAGGPRAYVFVEYAFSLDVVR